MGVAYQQGIITLLDTWFHPFLGHAYAPIVETSFPELVVFSRIFTSNIHRYFLDFAFKRTYTLKCNITMISSLLGKYTRMFIPKFPCIPEMLYLLKPKEIQHLGLRDSQEPRDKHYGIFPSKQWYICITFIVLRKFSDLPLAAVEMKLLVARSTFQCSNVSD